MLFAEIPGLDTIKQSLIGSYERNHIAHAQLFNSIPGGAGLTMAMAFATFLLCKNKSATDSCGTCPNCQKMSRLVHPDVHHIYPKPSPTKATPYEKIQAETLPKWRQFVTEQPYGSLDDWTNFVGYESKNLLISKEDSRQIIKTVSMKSFEGDFKILILWYPEVMHPAAANGILKVLEEPPTQTIYLLVSYAYDQLLSTIKSRTQIFNIGPFSESAINQYLIAEKGIEPGIAEKTARVADGSMGKAISDLDHIGSVAYQKFQSWMQLCQKGQFDALLKLSEEFGSQSKPQQRNELEFAISLIRESLLAKASDGTMTNRDGEEKIFIVRFGGYASFETLEDIYKNINKCISNLSRNASAKMAFMNLSISISQLLRRAQ